MGLRPLIIVGRSPHDQHSEEEYESQLLRLFELIPFTFEFFLLAGSDQRVNKLTRNVINDVIDDVMLFAIVHVLT